MILESGRQVVDLERHVRHRLDQAGIGRGAAAAIGATQDPGFSLPSQLTIAAWGQRR